MRRTRLKGDTLVSHGATPTPYVPLGSNRSRTERGTEVRFEVDSAPGRMIVRTTSDTVTFTRADTVALDSARLPEYAGDYRSD